MEKAKKKETLTLEERLQAALVPDWEQPYKLPENWCWTRLRVLLQNSKEKTSDFTNANLKYVGLEHMQKDYGIVEYDSAIGLKSLKNVFHPNQILYGKLRPYLNKHDVATFDGICSTDILVFNVTSLCIPKFVNFYLNQNTFIEYAVSNSKGINLPRISENAILDAKCPLPPLPEQQRIVDRIESLFAKLDEAKQKAQDALDSFETRKAAILHKAFTGELTAQWRKEHGVRMESWGNAALIDVCILRSGTTIPVEHELSNGNIPYVKVADMNLPENYLTITTSSRFVNSCAESQIIPYGSTIFPKRGGAILTNKKRFIAVPKIIADLNIMAIIPNIKLMNNWYCYYWMLSIDLRELNNGSNVPQINNKDMAKLYIPKPSLPEQTEIVRILDDILAKEQQAKETAEAVLEQIDMIKKSILARAFRGELGTNNPTEGSAVELVKKII